MLEKCDKCNNIATWLYMPSDGQYCDDCVPRGCSCNIYSFNEHYTEGDILNTDNVLYWSKEVYEKLFSENVSNEEYLKLATRIKNEDSFYYEIVDKEWRRFPCCEYDYDENGFDFDEL